MDDTYVDGYWAQGQNSACFVIAAANWSADLGNPIGRKRLRLLKRKARCDTGNAIQGAQVLDALGIPREPTEDAASVYDSGGIIKVMPPIWNLHAVYVRPGGETVNSWLGALVHRISLEDIRSVEPSVPNREYYVQSPESRHPDA